MKHIYFDEKCSIVNVHSNIKCNENTKLMMCLLMLFPELPFIDFLFEIELESSSISVIDEMRQYLHNITFPLQLDEVVEVLDVDITTGEE